LCLSKKPGAGFSARAARLVGSGSLTGWSVPHERRSAGPGRNRHIEAMLGLQTEQGSYRAARFARRAAMRGSRTRNSTRATPMRASSRESTKTLV